MLQRRHRLFGVESPGVGRTGHLTHHHAHRECDSAAQLGDAAWHPLRDFRSARRASNFALLPRLSPFLSLCGFIYVYRRLIVHFFCSSHTIQLDDMPINIIMRYSIYGYVFDIPTLETTTLSRVYSRFR